MIRAVIGALGMMRSPDARRALQALAQSADENVARSAAEALAKLTERD